MIAFALSIIAALAVALVSAEAKAWAPHLVRRLTLVAVSMAPVDLRERLKEEWTAYVDEVPGQLGKLLAVFGFIVASKRMRWSVALDRSLFRSRIYYRTWRLVVVLAATQMSRGSIRTRISRAWTMGILGHALGTFLGAILRVVKEGLRPPEFAANATQGVVSLIEDVLKDPSIVVTAHCAFNMQTGEFLRGDGYSGAHFLVFPPTDPARA